MGILHECERNAQLAMKLTVDTSKEIAFFMFTTGFELVNFGRYKYNETEMTRENLTMLSFRPVDVYVLRTCRS